MFPINTQSPPPNVLKVCVLIPGLTDEEVELAIQRSGSTEEVLPLSPVGPPYPLHATQLVPAPHSERTHPFIPFDTWCIYMILIFMCTVSPEKKSL